MENLPVRSENVRGPREGDDIIVERFTNDYQTEVKRGRITEIINNGEEIKFETGKGEDSIAHAASVSYKAPQENSWTRLKGGRRSRKTRKSRKSCKSRKYRKSRKSSRRL